MTKVSSQDLGFKPIGKLLVKQAVPASIGILVMSLNILVDTIFVGNWIGSIAIAAINVVLPVSFFIVSLYPQIQEKLIDRKEIYLIVPHMVGAIWSITSFFFRFYFLNKRLCTKA